MEATGVLRHLAPGITSFPLWPYVSGTRKKNGFDIQIQGEPSEEKGIWSMNRILGTKVHQEMPHLFLFLKQIQPGFATTCLTGGVHGLGKESLPHRSPGPGRNFMMSPVAESRSQGSRWVEMKCRANWQIRVLRPILTRGANHSGSLRLLPHCKMGEIRHT